MHFVSWRRFANRQSAQRSHQGAGRSSLSCFAFSFTVLAALLLLLVQTWHSAASHAPVLQALPLGSRRKSLAASADSKATAASPAVAVASSQPSNHVTAPTAASSSNAGLNILSAIGQDLRSFKHLALKAVSAPDAELSNVERATLYRLTSTLFGWLGRSSVRPWTPPALLARVTGLVKRQPTVDVSIAVSCGTALHRYAVTLVYQLRQVHTCDHLLEIFYSGAGDYRPSDRDALHAFHKSVSAAPIAFVDLRALMRAKEHRIKGWDLKPFAALFASGQQVLLLDADIVLLQSPEAALHTRSYHELGVTWFADRSLHAAHIGDANPIATVLGPLQPLPSASRTALRSLQDLTDFEIEAGVLAIDRRRPANLFGLLATCALKASLIVRQVIENNYVLPGDKEYFLFGWETVVSPYALMPYLPGVLGNWAQTEPQPSLGGRMLHFDEQGQPCWWNGGFTTCEDDARPLDLHARQIITPALFTAGSGHSTPQNWTIQKECACWVHTVDEPSQLRPLPAQYAAIANATLDFYAHGSKAYVSEQNVLT